MTEPYAYGIDPRDNPDYKRVIQRERLLRQAGQTEGIDQFGVQAVMILYPPLRFEPGKCVRLARDAEYPYCYEISIIGYPGFGTLDAFRFRITENGRTGEEFHIGRTATEAQFVNGFPAEWRRKVRVTGGNFGLEDGGQAVTGRYFIGFKELPDEFIVAQTDAPTDAEIAALVGYGNDGELNTTPLDPYGFTTNLDNRVIARLREVPFLCDDVPIDCETLVDTSVPSPIAMGALAYAAPVFGIGYSLLSVEPRVYQNIEGPFENDASKSPFLLYPGTDPFGEAPA